jgi:ATP synthase F0 subunit b
MFNNPTLWRVINLLVFLAVMVYLLRNKIGLGKVLDGRAESIRAQLEKARRDKEEAENRLREVEARLKRLDAEVADMRTESEREARRQTEHIREEAAADAEKIRLMTQREIDGAMKMARAELREFVAEKSVELAETIIRRDITPDDQKRILREYADELREVNK